MFLRRFFIVLIGLVLVLSGTGAAAEPAGTAVESIGGQPVANGRVTQPVSGQVDVTGTASVGEPAPETPDPLVADAGDSPYVAGGDTAVLLGMAFGGRAPYTYAWSSPVGSLAGADASSAELDTTSVPPGTYPVSLTVRDAAGVSATDTVRVVVVERKTVTLLDETRADPTPGAAGLATLEFPVEVPAGVERMDVAVTWTVAANDYDVRVLDPEGTERASSAGAPPATEERTGVSRPAPGTWGVAVDKFATAADQVRVAVTAVTAPADPRPQVGAGGPYRFLTGAEQTLTGTVSGGTGPVAAAWDLDADGVFETEGARVSPTLPEGRHLVTLKATDAAGLERRQTTSVLVANADRLAEETVPFSVIGIADTGINPYHLEFSAQAYPDPDVLARTDGFTRHPSEYIPGYPADAQALDITLGQGYFPEGDKPIWNGNETIQPGELYWIPGTKIVGAIDAGGSTGVTSGDDPHPILDDNGHGSGSASVSAGNRYGYCPTCLLVVVEALDETVVSGLPWVDVSSNSFGYVGGLPVGPVVGPNESTKAAAERGQTVLFAAGNGVGNAFDVPVSTYGSDQTGPDWTVTVGALRRDNQRAVIGDGIPVHISAWGDGNLPSACRSGTVGQCAFGGTSAATPYTAGVFATTLTKVRDAIGDEAVGQRPPVALPGGGTQGQVIAEGVPVPESGYLADGLLTRAELREAVLKTAYPLTGELSPYPYPVTAPYNDDTNVLFEGYGAATPEGARRATDVLLGRATLPDRAEEDEFFTLDRTVRDTIYGGYDRDGDGTTDYEGLGSSAGGPAALGVPAAELSTVAGAYAALDRVGRAKSAGAERSEATGTPLTYFLHRRQASAPGTAPSCAAADNELYLDDRNTTGDREPCFDSRVTSVAAAFRPLGIWASTEPLSKPLPADSTVDVDLYLTVETPAAVRPSGVLMATDREIGGGPGTFGVVNASGPGGALCASQGESCWTRLTLRFHTTRPAFVGEQLTFQAQLFGTRSWAFGYEGDHASRITVTPAPLPDTGFEFGARITDPVDGAVYSEADTVTVGGAAAFPDQGTDPTGAGDHPVSRKVQVSLDDPGFTDPVEAGYDPASGTWHVDLTGVPAGEHVVYARAAVDRTYSDADSANFVVRPTKRVEWQIVARNATPTADGWGAANGLTNWSFRFHTADYGTGWHTVAVRLVSDGVELARDSARVRFS